MLQTQTNAAGIARRELAPLALDAYPEAYLEFKQVMQRLLLGKTPVGSVEVCDGTAVDREDLASSLYHAAWETLGKPRGWRRTGMLPFSRMLLYLYSSFRRRISPSPRTGLEEPVLLPMLRYLLYIHSLERNASLPSSGSTMPGQAGAAQRVVTEQGGPGGALMVRSVA